MFSLFVVVSYDHRQEKSTMLHRKDGLQERRTYHDTKSSSDQNRASIPSIQAVIVNQ